MPSKFRRICFYDQCQANHDETLPEPGERRYMAGHYCGTKAGWYAFCESCAEQIDEEAEEAKKEGRYYNWNGGYDHITGNEVGE